MSSENNLWHDIVRPRLVPFGELVRIENRFGLGIPDVCYCLSFRKHPPATGWIELKHRTAWPRRDSDIVRIEHVTKEQVLWHDNWSKAGGRVFTLLRVAREFMLLSPSAYHGLYDGMTGPQIVGSATVYGDGEFPLARMLEALCG